MTQWPSTKARRVYAALLSVGWQLKRQSGSHRTLSQVGYTDFVFAFHDGDEIGPKMLARIAKHTGIKPGRSVRNEMPNHTLERTVVQCGRIVLAMDCVLADAQLQRWPAAQLGR